MALQDLEALEKKVWAEIKDYKEKLHNYTLQLKAIDMVLQKFSSKAEEIGRLKKRIKRLEKKLETTPNITPKQEKALIERISKLRKQLKEVMKIIRLQKKKDKLNEEISQISKILDEKRDTLTNIKKKIKLYKILGRSPDLPEGYVGTVGDVGIFEKEDK